MILRKIRRRHAGLTGDDAHLGLFAAVVLAGLLAATISSPLRAGQAQPSARPPQARASAPASAPILPLSQVRPGQQGVAYTIYQGDTVEPVRLEVIGVMPNALGPKQDVILVRLLGPKAQEDGVVAGMSGSPVYIDGRLVGALSLRLGSFTKEAIGGVTPIEEMLDVERSSSATLAQTTASSAAPAAGLARFPGRIPLPSALSSSRAFADVSAGGQPAGAEEFLEPIETPLIASGLYPETLARFGNTLSKLGVSVMAGGNSLPSPADADLKPGDMVGVDLVRGDLTMSAGCTVTTVVNGRILACGHPILGYGSVQMPLSRAHVLLTLASSLASTKVMTTGGVIGTLTQDRTTAIMGQLGPGPAMIPVEVHLTTPAADKTFHFQVIRSPQLTPLLVALATYNGISGNPAYGEGSTLSLDAEITIKDHTPVHLQDLFAPSDLASPGALPAAVEVQSAFAAIFSNPYEQPDIQNVRVRVQAVSAKRWAAIVNAWVDKTEVHPGDRLQVRVLLRPYRGEPFIQQVPITIPAQAAPGNLQLLVSDGAALDHNLQFVAASAGAELPGLEELIRILNREHRNDNLYVTLLEPRPTLLVEDKELPDAPLSEISVLDHGAAPQQARLEWQSKMGEWSAEMHQVVQGEQVLMLSVK